MKFRPFAGGGDYLHLTLNHSCPAFHASQTQAAVCLGFGLHGGDFKADPVVLYEEQASTVLLHDQDPHSLGLTVIGDIAQTLLNDPVEMSRGRRAGEEGKHLLLKIRRRADHISSRALGRFGISLWPQGARDPPARSDHGPADVYDALISQRVYKPSFPYDKAMRIIQEGKDIQFDPQLLDVFCSLGHQVQDIAEQFHDA